MQNIQTAHIVYFSGTGGTARMAEHMHKAFAAQGVPAMVTELYNQVAAAVTADCLVLLYPVYAANAPTPMDEWLAAAPNGQGLPAVVLSVSGGGEISPNTACRVNVIKQLVRKGYRVIYEDMLVMPSNFLVPYGDALSVLILRAAPQKAARIAQDVLAGKTRRTRPHWWDRALSKLTTIEKRNSKYFGKHLYANEHCTHCSWCARHCPRGNIAMHDGKPTYGDRCVLCLRCVYGCPSHAIQAGMGKFAVLKNGFDLDALEARTQNITDFPPVEQLAKGLLLKGVYRYLTTP